MFFWGIKESTGGFLPEKANMDIGMAFVKRQCIKLPLESNYSLPLAIRLCHDRFE